VGLVGKLYRGLVKLGSQYVVSAVQYYDEQYSYSSCIVWTDRQAGRLCSTGPQEMADNIASSIAAHKTARSPYEQCDQSATFYRSWPCTR